MKHVRTFLSLLVLGLMLSATAWAQGDISLGGGGDGDIASGISFATFSGDASVEVNLLHPFFADTSVAMWNYDDTIKTVSKRSEDIRVFMFSIYNGSAAQDTLTNLTVRSFNDREYMFLNMELYRDTDSTGSGTQVGSSITDIGASSQFTENQALAFSGSLDTIPAGETVYYWIEVDMDSARIVDTLYNDLFAGIKLFQNDIELASSGFAPTGVTDTLRYFGVDDGDPTTPHTVEGAVNGNGRTLIFDTKPPELTIDFALAADNDSCGGNGIVNLGDSIFVTAWDTTGEFETAAMRVNLQVFGGSTTEASSDTLAVGSDSAMTVGLKIPETSQTPALDRAPNNYYLVVTVEDEPGNARTDSVLVNYAIDNTKPILDSIEMVLVYDANADSVAAIGDSVQIYAYMTSNPYGEVDSVWADMSNWGYADTIQLEDLSGNRIYTRRLGLQNGTLDLAADSSGSRFWVWAYDNACNWNVDSLNADFAVDNEKPASPTTYTYVRYVDTDSNNVINIGDQVRFTIDASNTSDLTSTCEVRLNLLESGLGGSQTQCVEDTNTSGAYLYTHTVADGGIYAVDVAASNHTVDVTLTDNAGNTATYASSAVGFPVDTEAPDPVTSLTPTKGACAIELDWTAGNTDDSLYLIFWDGGDGSWDAADTTSPVGTSVDTSWTTDGTVSLTHGTTYEFVVRTIDDANNREWNFTRVSGVADCEAPVVCISYPSTGGAYGDNNDLVLVAESSADDIAGTTLWVRDKDQGTGTPSNWRSLGAMWQVSGDGQQFTDTVTNAQLLSLFPTATGDDEYEFITAGTDDVGNTQDTTAALAACPGPWYTMWFHTAIPIALMTVNDTASAQSSCGYNIRRDATNEIQIDVTNHTTGRTYIVDVFVDTKTAPNRVFYMEDVDTMPYTFNLDGTNLTSGTHTIYVDITRDDENTASMSFDVCVPDEDAPTASIIYPLDGQRVRRMNSVIRNVMVWAQVNTNAYDPSNVARVDFEHSLDVDSGYSVFDVETSDSSGIYRGTWDNRAFAGDAVVYLRAKFYDNEGNTNYTSPISVTLDSTATVINLTCPQAVSVNGVSTLADTVDFYAEIQESYNDFAALYLYHKKSTDPDIASSWDSPVTMAPATDQGVYVAYGVPTTGWTDEVNHDLRVIAVDITGNVMWDYDDDGYFDDNTFNPAANPSDVTYMVDNSPAPIAFSMAVAEGPSDTVTFYTPSAKLGGSDMIFAQKGADITLHTQTIPMSDSLDLSNVGYWWVDSDDTVAVGVSTNVAPYEIIFNPWDLGLLTVEDVDNNYYAAELRAIKTDLFGRTVSDTITINILDITANQAVVINPGNGSYVWGDVDISAKALNAWQLQYVDFYFNTSASMTGATKIATVDVFDCSGNFNTTWATLGEVDDGWYYLAAAATDSAFNTDANPPWTMVYVGNTLPIVTMGTPADSAFVGVTSMFGATVTNDAVPTQMVQFQYKPVTSASWTTWTTDYYPPYQALWADTSASDGFYHTRVMVTTMSGRTAYSDWKVVYADKTVPNVAPTQIAGQDVEMTNDPWLDLTGQTVIDIEGYFEDDNSSNGAGAMVNSGVAKIAVEFRDSTSGTSVLYKDMTFDPTVLNVTQALQFNISGLTSGGYAIWYYVWDAVGLKDSALVYGHISDQTAPTTSIVGYYNDRLYGRDWSSNSDVVRVHFEYRADGTTDWIGIPNGDQIGSTTFWWAPLDATSLDDGTYDFRMRAVDGSGNANDAEALIFQGTVASGVITWDAGSIQSVAGWKNYQNGVFNGVVRINAGTTEPGVLAIYRTGSTTNYEEIDLDEFLDPNTWWHGSFNFTNVGGGGTAMVLVGVPDGISSTWFSVYPYWNDYGTNGKVYSADSNITVTIPEGAGSGKFVLLETWLPNSGAAQDHWVPVGNQHGYANYIGRYESSEIDDDCFNNSKYAQVMMTYDATVETPADSLLVVRWDPSSGSWLTSGIYYLPGDDGFDVENHTVEFSTDCLYGIYAVVRIDYNTHPGPIDIEFRDAYPYCNGYVGPMPISEYPMFVFKVSDEYSGIDASEFKIKLNNDWVHETGTDAEFWNVEYDNTGELLKIWRCGGYETSPAKGGGEGQALTAIPPLPCGEHTLWIYAKNNQNNDEEFTWTFTIDCTKPTVRMDNYYVAKDPTITFYISDDLAGVDWDSVWVDVIVWSTTDTNAGRPNQDDIPQFWQSFTGEQVQYYMVDDTTVQITTSFNLQDERYVTVAIYDGETSDFDDPTGVYSYYGYWTEFYLAHDGIHDCVMNKAEPWIQMLTVDYDGPSFHVEGETDPDVLPTGCPVRIHVSDDGGPLDRVEVYEDGVLVSDEERFSFDATTGMVEYCPTKGTTVTMYAYDSVGNYTKRTWLASSGDPFDTGEDPYAYPNPFDPRQGETVSISTGFVGQTTVTIYDFAGTEVWSGTDSDGDGEVTWYGYSSDGERVSNGVYFAYCEANDGRHKVVKIAVVER